MPSKFKVGDVVQCINARYTEVTRGVILGSIYRVTEIAPGGQLRLEATSAKENYYGGYIWLPNRFVKASCIRVRVIE